MDTWQAIDEERSALADDLETLDDVQWDTQSWCDEWKVRHVVGHLIGGADVKVGPFLVGTLKNGMNFNRVMACEGLAIGAAPPDELLGSSGRRSGRDARRRGRTRRSCSPTWCVTAGTCAARVA
jgi:uncharacterized protein (TIGR03083 family)